MLEFLVQRGAISVITLFIISLIVFTGVRLIPGDPARVLAGTEADEAGLEEVRAKYGLRDPIPVQYVRWVALAIAGDLGESIRTRASVTRTVAQKLPITLELVILALGLALLIGVPAGIVAAHRHNRAAVERVSLRHETTSASQIAALTGEHAPPARPLDDRGVPEPGDAERRPARSVELR